MIQNVKGCSLGPLSSLPGKIRLVVIPPLATILMPLSLGLKASNTLTYKKEKVS
jgi:hypothetical protein